MTNCGQISIALNYLRLWRATGKALYRAKAEALVATVLAAQNPQTGDIPMSLGTGATENRRLKPDHPAIRFGIMLRDLLAAGRVLEEMDRK